VKALLPQGKDSGVADGGLKGLTTALKSLSDVDHLEPKLLTTSGRVRLIMPQTSLNTNRPISMIRENLRIQEGGAVAKKLGGCPREKIFQRTSPNWPGAAVGRKSNLRDAWADSQRECSARAEAFLESQNPAGYDAVHD